jgi:hypothetical protein
MWTDGGRAAVAALAVVVAFAANPAAALSLDEKLRLLVEAYPQALEKVDDGHLVFRDGGPPMTIDDGAVKDHFGKIASGDIEDSLSQLYPPGACEQSPAVNADPGRIRSDALMMRLYGGSKAEAAAGLVSVEWFGEKLKVTRRQGVAEALARVRDDLAKKPELRRYLVPSAGTFNWRKVAGATNMSVHSFGAAIDLNTKFADYWIWAGGRPGRVPEYRNKYPMEIVEAFERHGFIWGGRWYHYDTMHFEYRPELIAIGRAAGASAC